MGNAEQQPNKKLFREKALQQLESPEQLNQLLQVTNRRAWISLWTLAGSVLVALLWGMFGEIPMTVDGAGILVYPRQVISLQTPASGEIATVNVHVGDTVHVGEVLATLDQPAIRQQLDQERVRLSEAQTRDREVSSLASERRRLERQANKRQSELLRARIKSLTAMAEEEKRRTERYIAQQRKNIKNMHVAQTQLGKTLAERYQTYTKLLHEGLTSQDLVLAAREKMVNNHVQIADLALKLQEMELKRSDAEDHYNQQMAQVDSLRSDLQQLGIKRAQMQQQHVESSSNRKLKIEELQRSIARYENELQNKSKVISDYKGRVLEVTAEPGQLVSAGQRIGAIETENPKGKLVALTYFPIGAGKKVMVGMNIHITPTTVERERYGSMIGKVTAVSAFPVTTEAVSAVIGNGELAQGLVHGASTIQVTAELETNPNAPSGYRWTSGRGPSEHITAGTTTAARVTIEHRLPISFVIPILRRWSGIR